MVSFEEYVDKKRKQELAYVDIISNADLEAVERERERIIRTNLGLPEPKRKLNYDLCRKHDAEEFDRFQKAADQLMKEIMKDPEAFFN